MVKENNIIRINNTKIKDTMALLQNKLDEVGMSQAELARELKRNKVTINRWSHNTRDISAANAIEIAKVLNCDPAEILFPAKKLSTIELHSYAEDYIVKNLPKKSYRKIIIPEGFYTPQTKAIQFYNPGAEDHNEIHLFERTASQDEYNGFSEYAIDKTCYIEATDQDKKKGYRDVIAIIEKDRTHKEFKLNLLHPETKKPFKNGASVHPRELKLAAPRKMVYLESYNSLDHNHKNNNNY
tara:strand:+ start:375 stop:1094 length:720 start_codon:yes stop_codon:yes gene_type:complete